MTHPLKAFIAASALVFQVFVVFANNAAYEQRRTDYIATSLNNFNSHTPLLQAYNNVPLDQAALNDMIGLIGVKSTLDFDIVKMIRIMYLTNGAYDNFFFPALDTVPFWIRKNQWLYGYWSENHMIMWMSSDWLLHERFGRAIDANLDKRLRHYLKLKLKYGFYEFFSSVYAPYCLSGLINLADFAQDAEIKSLATQACVRLLRELLMVTNNQGVFYPSAGRNYYSKYVVPYHENHNSLIWLLTGMGEPPTQASHSGAFLASSSLQIDSIASTWKPQVDTLYSIGHPIDSFSSIHKDMAQVDKVMFQWSAGAYFHPKVAYESAVMIRDSNLWNHVDFVDYKQYQFFSANDAPAIAEYASYATKSSTICGQDVAIFKSNGVLLTSVQDFWKGKLGHQQFPCVATVGTSAVVVASGKVNKTWQNRSSANANEHLPYVAQNANAAMLMFRQEPVPLVFTYKNPEVALLFKDEDYDEVQEENLWLLGRQNENYVAVRRYCIDEIDSVRACPEKKGQTWAIVVGDSATHGSFSAFRQMIAQSSFTDSWSLDTTVSPWQHNYYAKVIVDGKTLEHLWQRDSVLETSIAEINLPEMRIFPNPASSEVSIAFDTHLNGNVKVMIADALGKQVSAFNVEYVEEKTLKLRLDLPNGVYVLVVHHADKTIRKKLMISR